MAVHTTRWTPADDERLIALADGKRSAREIARLMGVASKNSVIGRMARLRETEKLPPGVKLRPSGFARRQDSTAPRPPRKGSAPKSRKPDIWLSRPHIQHERDLAVLSRFAEGYLGQSGMTSLSDLRGGQCRFPIDQPSGGVRFCGSAAEANGSWCPHHAARVFNNKAAPV